MAAAEIVRIAKNLFKSIPYNYCITKNIPIDTRFVINDINTIDTEIPIKRRYSSLIFWAEVQQSVYIFDKDLSTPKLLISFIGGATILQIDNYVKALYGTLLEKLQAINPKPGAIVNIEPIKVCFIYDGTNWRYFNGDYNFASVEDYASFDEAFKQPGAIAFINGVKHIIATDKTLTPEVIVADTTPTVVENNRYYLLHGILHYAIAGSIYRIGTRIKLVNNIKLTNNTIITHNFNSPYIRGFFRINSMNPSINNYLVDLSIQAVDDNSVRVDTNAEVTGDLILFNNI